MAVLYRDMLKYISIDSSNYQTHSYTTWNKATSTITISYTLLSGVYFYGSSTAGGSTVSYWNTTTTGHYHKVFSRTSINGFTYLVIGTKYNSSTFSPMISIKVSSLGTNTQYFHFDFDYTMNGSSAGGGNSIILSNFVIYGSDENTSTYTYNDIYAPIAIHSDCEDWNPTSPLVYPKMVLLASGSTCSQWVDSSNGSKKIRFELYSNPSQTYVNNQAVRYNDLSGEWLSASIGV